LRNQLQLENFPSISSPSSFHCAPKKQPKIHSFLHSKDALRENGENRESRESKEKMLRDAARALESSLKFSNTTWMSRYTRLCERKGKQHEFRENFPLFSHPHRRKNCILVRMWKIKALRRGKSQFSISERVGRDWTIFQCGSESRKKKIFNEKKEDIRNSIKGFFLLLLFEVFNFLFRKYCKKKKDNKRK
jgi:hypothetical protein